MREHATPIKSVLEAVIFKMSGEKKHTIERIKEAWQAAVDKKTHIHARPVSFRSGRLVVNVDSSAWMYELNLRKGEILAKLNEAVGEKRPPAGEKGSGAATGRPAVAIKELMLRIGEVR